MTVLIHTASDARISTQPSHALVRSPAAFDGTLEDFIERYILPDLPTPSAVTAFHHALAEYVAHPDALFLLRAVSGTERRVAYRTNDGTRFKATDNAPAWWAHAMLAQGYEIAPGAFGEVVDTMPAHLFDIRSSAAPTANAAGWHIAHIFDVKDGDTNYAKWHRADVARRFVRNVHPCNYFPLPKPEWRRWGGDERVIGVFAAVYASRYASVWREFLALADATENTLSRITGSVSYSYSVSVPGRLSVDQHGSALTKSAPNAPGCNAAAEYRVARLTFKRDAIEPLQDTDILRIVTAHGTFEMTRADFYEVFPNVVRSRSYRDGGNYNCPTIPRAAERFRI